MSNNHSSSEPQKQETTQTDKVYGAFKVSEYTHSTGKRSYQVDESSGVPARQAVQSEQNKKIEEMAAQLEE